MQKLLFFLGLFWLVFSAQAQIQSGEIIYKIKNDMDLEMLGDTISLNEGSKKYLMEVLSKLDKAQKYFQYKLAFNREEAIYKDMNSIPNDNGIDLSVASGTFGSGIYYTNLKENLSFNQRKTFNKLWLIQRNLDDLSWKLKTGTKTIQGYDCKKAVIPFFRSPSIQPIAEITVWYAPDLPFQFGPIHLFGLPGMILGVEFEHVFLYAAEITLHQKEMKFNRPSKGVIISEAEYIQKIKDQYRQPGF